MKKFTAVAFLVLVVGGVAILPGKLADDPTLAAVLGTIAFFTYGGLMFGAGALLSAFWTRRAMADGAGIALKAQEVNDSWDAKKTLAFAGLMREGASIGRQIPVALPYPMPGQQGEPFSLPPLAEFGGQRLDVIDSEARDGQ